MHNYLKVCGVKGPSVLTLHHCFDLVGGVVVDDLHCIYLGVTLRLLHLWFDKTYRGKPFFIGDKVFMGCILCAYLLRCNIQIVECDKRLLSISH